MQIKNEDCLKEIRQILGNDVSDIECDLKLKKIIVKSSLPWYELQKKIERDDRRVVLAGYGTKSAVSTIYNADTNVRGVVRFASADNPVENVCVVDGTLDGLPHQKIIVHIHESGDLSQVMPQKTQFKLKMCMSINE